VHNAATIHLIVTIVLNNTVVAKFCQNSPLLRQPRADFDFAFQSRAQTDNPQFYVRDQGEALLELPPQFWSIAFGVHDIQ